MEKAEIIIIQEKDRKENDNNSKASNEFGSSNKIVFFSLQTNKSLYSRCLWNITMEIVDLFNLSSSCKSESGTKFATIPVSKIAKEQDESKL